MLLNFTLAFLFAFIAGVAMSLMDRSSSLVEIQNSILPIGLCKATEKKKGKTYWNKTVDQLFSSFWHGMKGIFLTSWVIIACLDNPLIVKIMAFWTSQVVFDLFYSHFLNKTSPLALGSRTTV